MKPPFFTLFFLLLTWHSLQGQARELALARRYDFVADSLLKIPSLSRSILYRKKALNIYQNQKPLQFDKIASAFRSIGVIYRREGKFQEAEFHLKRAVEISEKHLSAQHPERAKAFNSYGIYLLTKGDYELSLSYLNKSLAINKLMKLPGIADNLNNIGIIYENLGEYDQAYNYYLEAYHLNRKELGLDNLATANNLINLGTACLRLNLLDKATAYFDSTLGIYNKILPDMHPEFAALYNNLGAVANTKGDFRSAIHYFELALKNSEANLGENHPDVANIFANTGILLLNRGDVNKGLAFFKKAYYIRQRFLGTNNHLVARTCNYLGDCYLEKKDFDNAYHWYNQAITIYQKLPAGDPTDYAEYKNDLGFYFEKLNNHKEALRLYNEALSVVRKQPERQDLDIANSLDRIGNVQLSKANYSLAKANFEKALAIYQQLLGSKHPDVAQIYSKLAFTEVETPQKALSYCDSAMTALGYRATKSFDFEAVTSPLILLKVLQKKGELLQTFYKRQKELKWLNQADQTYGIAVKLIDFIKITLEEPGSRQALLDNYFLVYENAITTKHELKKRSNDPKYWHEAFEIAERSNATLLLEAMQAVQAGRFAGVPDSLLEQERKLKLEVAFLEKQVYEEQLNGPDAQQEKVAKLNNQIFLVQRKITNLMQQMKDQYPSYFTLKYATEVVDVPTIQKELLLPGQNMLGYFVGEEHLFAFVISEENFDVIQIDRIFPLDVWVEDFRTSIYNYNPTGKDVAYLSQKYANLGHELYQLLFDPIRPFLTGKQIVILPGGVLGYLPFDALLASAPENDGNFDTHDYLLKHYQFSYSYSATLHKEMMGKSLRWRTGGFAAFAPSYGGDSLNLRSHDPWRAVLGNLRFNKSEAFSIQKIMGGKVYADSAATEANFMETAPNAGILHLAVHAKSNDEHGEYSYLAFFQTADSTENELVFVKDLYSLRIKAALVVLSACETGIGELQRGEGIVSLARGFSYAGAASIVTTLWSIDDYASSEIMVDFYKNLKEGVPKDEALRAAKLGFLNKRKGSNASHPLYWAAFIPVGDMSPINDEGIPIWGWSLMALAAIAISFKVYVQWAKKPKIIA